MSRTNNWLEETELVISVLDNTEMEKAVKWGGDVYTINGKNVVSYGGFTNHFSIWFYNGVFLTDPDKVLVNANEAKTKALRQWRITDVKELDKKKLRAYVLEAIKNEKEGKSWKPQRSAALTIPATLQKAFKKYKGLKTAFNKLPPYKQKDYIEHFTTAKKEETNLARIEKSIPLILQGIGLHDKYKK